MRRKKYCKPMMDQCRMWRTVGKVGLTSEPVISTGMRVRIATIQMRRKKHRKLTMYHYRMWRMKGIVLESVMIGHYISDL
jgi:hypothetical protein